MSYSNIRVEVFDGVGLIRLDRPSVLNALNAALMQELGKALQAMEVDDAIRAMVITGSDRAFAAGADISEIQSKGFSDLYLEDFVTADWEHVTRCRKPVIAQQHSRILGLFATWKLYRAQLSEIRKSFDPPRLRLPIRITDF
jgi:enoyl-CoA hydratase